MSVVNTKPATEMTEKERVAERVYLHRKFHSGKKWKNADAQYRYAQLVQASCAERDSL